MDSEEREGDSIHLSNGQEIAKENHLPGIFSMNAAVVEKKFGCSVTYSECSKQLAEKFIRAYEKYLTQIVEWCTRQTKVHITESDMYRLTPLQEGMYYHNQEGEGDVSYLLQSLYRSNVRLNVEYLRKALECLSEKYETLKTAFGESRVDGGIRQYIEADRKIEFSEISYDQNNDEELIKEYLSKDLERGYDLKKDSLMRVAVLRFKDSDFLFIGNHHLIVDGWCNPLILGDLVRFYNLFVSECDESKIKKTILEEKRDVMPFREYVEWIDRIKKSELESFWSKYLDGFDTVAEIKPIEKVHEMGPDKIVKKYTIISEGSTDRLLEISKKNEVTISTISQMAVGYLLQKHCRVSDIMMGNVVSGRNIPIHGIENSVGMFINTVPIRIRMDDQEISVLEWLKQLQASNNAVSNYDHVALGELKIGSRNASEYMKQIFVFENYPGDGTDEEKQNNQDELMLTPIFGREQTNYDLTIGAFVDRGSLIFRFEYNSHKYTERNIELLQDHLRNIIDQIVDDVTQKVCDLDMTGQAEKHLVLDEFNQTLVEYDRSSTILELFEEQVHKTPDEVAVVYEGLKLTYSELNNRANRIAYKLLDLDVHTNDLVVIVADRSVEMMVGIMGILKSGAAYVPLDTNYPDERIHYILEDCKPKAVLTYNAAIVGNEVSKYEVIDLKEYSSVEEVYENPKIPVQKNDPMLQLGCYHCRWISRQFQKSYKIPSMGN